MYNVHTVQCTVLQGRNTTYTALNCIHVYVYGVKTQRKMVLTLQKMKPNEEKQVIVIFWPDSLTVVHSITCRSCSTTVRATGLERGTFFCHP